MPRPPYKRAKHNHPTPSNQRVSIPSPKVARAELHQKLAHKPISHGLQNSDDSDNLVTTSRAGRHSRVKPKKEIYASGAVAQGDKPAAHRSSRRQIGGQEKANTTRPITKIATKGPVPAEAGASTNPTAPQLLRDAEHARVAQNSSPAIAAVVSVTRAPTRLQSTPGADASILGAIKPRNRQPSILRVIENNDSSHIGDEDVDDFLPNDESTPANITKDCKTSSPNTSHSQQSVSRKRKRTTPSIPTPVLPTHEKTHDSRGLLTNRDGNSRGAEPQLPGQPTLIIGARAVTPEYLDPLIAAPPESSSPTKSPVKTMSTSPSKSDRSKRLKKAQAPSTKELQALMPTRRKHKNGRRRPAAGDFEIPADSDGEGNDTITSPDSEDEDDSVFTRKQTGRKASSGLSGKAKLTKKPRKARMQARGRIKQSTISPNKAVTPLKRTAKPSLQPASTRTSKATTKATYASRHRNASNNKENQPDDLSGDISGAADENETLEFDEGDVAKKRKQKPATELEKAKALFADIDDWDMEFEDVSAEGIVSSSPNRR